MSRKGKNKAKITHRPNNVTFQNEKVSKNTGIPDIPPCINGWRFNNCARRGRWPWTELEKQPVKFLEVYNKMRNLENTNFTELRKSKSKNPRNKFIPIDALIKDAQNELAESKKDVDELFSIRLSKKERVWCICDPLNIMEVLWWDPRHKVCPSKYWQ